MLQILSFYPSFSVIFRVYVLVGLLTPVFDLLCLPFLFLPFVCATRGWFIRICSGGVLLDAGICIPSCVEFEIYSLVIVGMASIFSFSFLMFAFASSNLFSDFDAALPRAITSGSILAKRICSDMLLGSVSGMSCLHSISDTACLCIVLVCMLMVLCICRCVNALIRWWQNRPVVFFIMNKFSEC